jgi:hypothetical protein
MATTQISVFLENKKGRLAEVTKLLSDAGINMRALSLGDTADFGVLRIIVNDPAACLRVLKERRFIAQATEVIAVEVDDRPGGLYRILEVLDAKDINIEYMYACLERKVDNAIVVLKIDTYEEAVKVLRENGFSVLSEDVVRNL